MKDGPCSTLDSVQFVARVRWGSGCVRGGSRVGGMAWCSVTNVMRSGKHSTRPSRPYSRRNRTCPVRSAARVLRGTLPIGRPLKKSIDFSGSMRSLEKVGRWEMSRGEADAENGPPTNSELPLATPHQVAPVGCRSFGKNSMMFEIGAVGFTVSTEPAVTIA